MQVPPGIGGEAEGYPGWLRVVKSRIGSDAVQPPDALRAMPNDHPQLPLPHVDASQASGHPASLARDRRIYVNRSLRMDSVEWIGFDMDYTLAIYRQEAIDQLSIEATLRKLL